MSVATDLQTIAENVPLVYEAGKQKQYNDFWDAFQNHGNRTNYEYAFAGTGFTDDILSPKYPLPVFANNNYARYMFISNNKVKHISFPLSFSAKTNTYLFAYATSLKTVDSITVTDTVEFLNWFTSCTALENITFYGTIGNNIDIHWSTKLSVMSAKSILSHLSTNGSGKTVTFASEIQSAVEADAEAAALISTAQANGWTVTFS